MLAMSNPTQPLPNPDTYLNHLTPDDAAQFEVVRIIYATFLGAIVWDILAFLPQDVKILKQGGRFVMTICYLLTRLTAATCVLLWVIMQARPISNCEGVLIGINIACVLTLGTSSYLFLKRAQAVYSGNLWAQWGFVLAFILANLSNLLPIFSISMKHVPGTGYCTTAKVQLYGTTSYFMALFFDSLIFFSISYKIAYTQQENDDASGNWAARIFSSRTLPLLSKAILQGGQKYYLVGVISRIAALVMTFTPSMPPRYRIASMAPSVAVTAVMVCRVHRDMVLVFHNLSGDITGFRTRPLTSMRFAHAPLAPQETTTVVIKTFSETVSDYSNQKVIETRSERPPSRNIA